MSFIQPLVLFGKVKQKIGNLEDLINYWLISFYIKRFLSETTVNVIQKT